MAPASRRKKGIRFMTGIPFFFTWAQAGAHPASPGLTLAGFGSTPYFCFRNCSPEAW